jgi:hypothetical protein
LGRAAAKHWTLQPCPDDKYHFVSKILEYVESFNGRLPPQQYDTISYVAGYAPSHGLKRIKRLIQKSYDFLLTKIREETVDSGTVTLPDPWE